MNPFLLNPARMAFQVPGVLGGFLVAGSKGRDRPVQGNGDCVLLDGACGLVGVADGSERSPEASRAFLQGLSDRMSGCPVESHEERLRHFHAAVQATLESFGYEDRTTFVCLLSVGDGTVAYVCGGDSLLFHLDPGAGRIRFRNRANMGFSGRTRQILDSGRLVFRRGDLALLTTDGVWDLTGGDSDELVRAFFEGLKSGPFHDMPERLSRDRHPAFDDRSIRPHDDFGVLLLDPFGMASLSGRMLAGGTSGTAEARYLREVDRRALPDRYVPLPLGDRDLWLFPEDLSAVETDPPEPLTEA